MQLFFDDRDDWRAWLAENHDTAEVVWLVFFKKHTGRPCLDYEAAVEEALCFGWIDSLVKRLDEDRYARKFTPRVDISKWSAANLRRFRNMVEEGRMTEVGLAKMGPDVQPAPLPSARSMEVPRELEEALECNPKAREFFDRLAPSHRRHFIGWIDSAKRAETRERRTEEAIRLFAQGKKLGLK